MRASALLPRRAAPRSSLGACLAPPALPLIVRSGPDPPMVIRDDLRDDNLIH